MWVRHRVDRLLYFMLCTALHFVACSEAIAAPDRVATPAAVHPCPNGKAMTVRRPVGFDGRRIRPID